MKLTKSELKQIIQEELQNVLQENDAENPCKEGYVPKVIKSATQESFCAGHGWRWINDACVECVKA